jgi:hypothetical protein
LDISRSFNELWNVDAEDLCSDSTDRDSRAGGDDIVNVE